MRKEGRTIYYTKAKDEEFNEMNPKINLTIDDKYKYLPRCWLVRFFYFFFYYCIALPILIIFTKLSMGVKIKGRKNLKAIKSGFVVCANHTNSLDCVNYAVNVAAPRRAYQIGLKYSLQLPFIRVLVKILGILPIADTMGGLKNFNKAVSTILERGNVLIVFPEAHIFPYYTGLRDFSVTSFKFSAKNNVPIVPCATTFRKRKVFKNCAPKITINIGEPIYPDTNLSTNENAVMMHDKAVEFINSMVNQDTNYSFYNYVLEEDITNK